MTATTSVDETTTVDIAWHVTSSHPPPGGIPRRRAWDAAPGVRVRLRVISPCPCPDTVPERARCRRESPDVLHLVIHAPTWEDARVDAVAIAARVSAARRGLLHLRAHVLERHGEGGALLVVGADPAHPPGGTGDACLLEGPHVLIDTRHTPPRAVTRGSWTLDEDESRPEVTHPLRGILIVDPTGQQPRYVPPKTATAHLRAALPHQHHDQDRDFVAASAAENRILDVAAALIAFSVRHIAPEPDEMLTVPTTATYTREDLTHLRTMQATAARVYGRLEPDRALAWTLEELGELAQAIRRRESPARIGEELGQLLSWVLCLANICGLDLADAADLALRREVLRHLAVHGALRPHEPASPFRSAS
ncbi:MazG nucleotide pyrophosphohydrolase domain-containing protein [Embleya sp. MST-111070]|uniref:MazG nucleotide pyrophosphohydrolase domain-containing protein n=1 Tax=Embleya sp. MST-111070 TaxID=3398231 RepID=UPI003F738895